MWLPCCRPTRNNRARTASNTTMLIVGKGGPERPYRVASIHCRPISRGLCILGKQSGFGSRLRFARGKWGLTQAELAAKSGVSVTTIRREEGRAESGKFSPRMETAHRLAAALSVRVEWLLTGDAPMLSLADLTVDEQHRQQNGPEQAGLPGYVIVGPGPWSTDDDDEWRVDPDFGQRQPHTESVST